MYKPTKLYYIATLTTLTVALLTTVSCGGSKTTTNSNTTATTVKTDNSSVNYSHEFEAPIAVSKFGYGKSASAAEIAGWDIDIRPDGKGLPKGKGTAKEGEPVYAAQCAVCHGEFGEGVGRWPKLAGGEGSIGSDEPEKSVGSYWPYTSTLFDYVRRAMPYFAPQSLTDDQVYAVVAYLLNLNDIIEEDFELNEGNLASIKLANEDSFYPKEGDYLNDPRNEDIKNTICMKDCVKEVKVVESISGVTPSQE